MSPVQGRGSKEARRCEDFLAKQRQSHRDTDTSFPSRQVQEESEGSRPLSFHSCPNRLAPGDELFPVREYEHLTLRRQALDARAHFGEAGRIEVYEGIVEYERQRPTTRHQVGNCKSQRYVKQVLSSEAELG